MFSTEAVSTPETASVLVRKAPTDRWIGGAFSTLFGGMSATRGVLMFAESGRTREERFAGGLLLALGSMRLMDGVHRLFHPTAWEMRGRSLADVPAPYRQQATYEWLRSSARESRRMKWIRSSLLALNGLTYLYLSQHNRDRNGSLVYPGVTLLGIALFRGWRDTNAEKAWRVVADGPGAAIQMNF